MSGGSNLEQARVITKGVSERLYGALCKLRDYEDTGAHPDAVEMLMEKYVEAATLLTIKLKFSGGRENGRCRGNETV